jgi:hypothetical protein
MMNYAKSSKGAKVNYGTGEGIPMDGGGAQSELKQGLNMGGYEDKSFKASCVNKGRCGGSSSNKSQYPK